MIPDDLRQAFERSAGAARAELERESMDDIQKKTAIAWTGRAIAAYEKAAATKSVKALLDAETFHSEAIEHAAFACPVVLEAVTEALGGWQTRVRALLTLCAKTTT